MTSQEDITAEMIEDLRSQRRRGVRASQMVRYLQQRRRGIVEMSRYLRIAFGSTKP